MLKWTTLIICFSYRIVFAFDEDNRRLFFSSLNNLDFKAANHHASLEADSAARYEMHRLATLLFYEGRTEKLLPDISTLDSNDKMVDVFRALNNGYTSLFFDKVKGASFKSFYDAYQQARQLNYPWLIKACLAALMKYYNVEIAQYSEAHLPYLKHYESLQADSTDRIWVTLYYMIFYTKSLDSLNEDYFAKARMLDKFERRLSPGDPLLAPIYYEQGLRFEIENNPERAAGYYKKTLDPVFDYPFLKYQRFFASLKIMKMETLRGNFPTARIYLQKARMEANRVDTMRSNYHLNRYAAVYYRTQNMNDSAFISLSKAYDEDFLLDFRRNSMEINRLTVELETREKENAILRLRASQAWLTLALTSVALLLIGAYFAYANQAAKNKMHASEKKIQAMKLEKLLKDHELFGINSMIEGQERERQRIANDLHDNLGGLLAAINLQFATLKMRIGSLGADENMLYEKTNQLIQEAYQQVRSMAHAKNAGVNAQEGLLPAVKYFASKVSILNKLSIDVEEHGMEGRLENSFEITIFRIIQELVTNVIKHAHATEVTIHLTQYEDKLNLMVEDNGLGFDASAQKSNGTMGLYSIQKRIENLGGTVTIDSILQSGTTVILDIPLT
ncbi:sensor histidine kinase [Chryseolinea sp. T2]|uniref:sensor histidine kinase n=1 Tax=Chryseolinea sp. T2 TaxID=3129255 RepID=UPI003077498C